MIVRGTYVETHSDGTNRINGGQVQIIVISPGVSRLQIGGLVGPDDPADDVPVDGKLGLAVGERLLTHFFLNTTFGHRRTNASYMPWKNR